ncbi:MULTISPECIES: hypothetical protein [unclassified Butyrivibrio]|uniref:hypothetical protein n=1 Tax=unclassified Butyrivibrio TaxID=2639466 RepID=UPI00047BD5FA|nr:MULTISPECIES: hypothetical protein [unclassified Butyrivibrio]
MKKKLLATMFALALATSSVACGAQKVEPATNNNAESEASAEAAPSDSSNENAAESTSSESSDASDSGENISGVVNGTTYENKFFGVKFSLGDNYKFANAEELQTLNSTITDLDAFKDNKAAKKALDSGSIMVVTYAVDGTTGKTLNVVLQSVGSLAGALANEQSIMESQKEPSISALEAQGLTDVTAEMETVKFLGEDHPSLVLNAKINGTVLYQRCICLIKDGYIITFTGSGLEADNYDSELLSAEKIAE